MFSIIHIVSASPTSTDIREVLLRICRELKGRFPAVEWNEVRFPPLIVKGGATAHVMKRKALTAISVGSGGGCCRCNRPLCRDGAVVCTGVACRRVWLCCAQEDQEDYQAVKDGFFKTLELAGACAIEEKCPIVLIIDAINQLNPFYNALTMDWFPTCLYVTRARLSRVAALLARSVCEVCAPALSVTRLCGQTCWYSVDLVHHARRGVLISVNQA